MAVPFVHVADLKRPAIIAALLVPALILGGAAIFAATRPDDADTADIVAYPDLQAREPLRLRLSTQRTDNKELLRFETIIWNSGAGPLEVRPENREDDASTYAFQRLYTWGKDGEIVFVREATVGSFAFHPEHKHWHLGDFADYELHSVADDGSVGDEIVAQSDKISFCLLDDEEIDLDMERSPQEAYYGKCRQDAIQGISVGWGDSYESFLPGQSIDISGVPDGEYWLVFDIDPDNLLEESDEDNNTSAVKLKLSGDEIEVFYKEATPTPADDDEEEGE
jgi:hypothetical protein